MSAFYPALTSAEVVAQTVENYYCQASAFTILTSERAAWFLAQPSEQRTLLAAILPAQWDLMSAFQRYVLEARGYSMRAYMAAHLTADQLAHWIDDGHISVQLPKVRQSRLSAQQQDVYFLGYDPRKEQDDTR